LAIKNFAFMSFALKVYTVDLKSLAALYGSAKLELVKLLLSKYSSEIVLINDWNEAEINAETALQDIINGSCSSSSGEIYAQVLELICKETGMELAADEWSDLSMTWIMDINMEASLPIPSLPIPENYPYVLSIFNKAADEFIENFRALDYEPAAMSQAELWFQKLEKEKKDLVLFFY
jgi:hypothetical protein